MTRTDELLRQSGLKLHILVRRGQAVSSSTSIEVQRSDNMKVTMTALPSLIEG